MIVLIVLFHLITIFQKCSSQAMTEAELKNFLDNDYEKAASENCKKFMSANWDHLTDISNDTKDQIFKDALSAYNRFETEHWKEHFKNLNPDDYKDEKIKRQLKILRHLQEPDNSTIDQRLWAYESPDFVKEIDRLSKEIEPFFMELRKYIGRTLEKKFGKLSEDADPRNEPFFGYMYDHYYEDIVKALQPFPDVKMIELNEGLKEQKYTILKMFQTADEFFQSMGLLSSDMSYDVSKGAIIEKPTDGRQTAARASAWDFCDRKTFRILMKTKINSKDFRTIHHELSHIQYFLQYSKQPYIFRSGANPAFHEAVSATITLSSTTPKHLKKIGLLNNFKETKEAYLNSLMDLAVEKVACLPYIEELEDENWRLNVFHKKVNSEELNSHWYLKIKPRSDSDDKFSIRHEYNTITIFVMHILQFQIYKSLCKAAGEYDPVNKKVPLHQCDFYQSKEAGKKLSAGLALGSSENWRNVLKKITGEKKMDVSGLLEYFEPLHKFLTKENSEENSKDVTEHDNITDIMRESNSVGTMGSTMYFVLLIEIIVCTSIS